MNLIEFLYVIEEKSEEILNLQMFLNRLSNICVDENLFKLNLNKLQNLQYDFFEKRKKLFSTKSNIKIDSLGVSILEAEYLLEHLENKHDNMALLLDSLIKNNNSYLDKYTLEIIENLHNLSLECLSLRKEIRKAMSSVKIVYCNEDEDDWENQDDDDDLMVRTDFVR